MQKRLMDMPEAQGVDLPASKRGAKTRKVYSAAFKAKVGLEAVRGARTVSEIAEQHGVHRVMVSQWKKEILQHAEAIFSTRRGPKSAQASNQPTGA